MLSDEEIIDLMKKYIGQSRLINERWRTTEVNENFALMEGEVQQWAYDDLQRQTKNGMPFTSVDKITPIINSIVGFEIQNRSQVKYNAWVKDEMQQHFNEILNDCAAYIDQESNADYAESLAFKDMLICGIGITDTNIDYIDNPLGQVKKKRIFPPFVFWDLTARDKNLLDANYVIKMIFLDDDMLKQTYGENVSADNISSAADPWIMQYFQTTLIGKNINVLYEYQWREKESTWRVDNPLPEIMELAPDELRPDIIDYFARIGAMLKFNPATDKEFTVYKKSDLANLRKEWSAFDYRFDYVEQKTWAYFRAVVSGNEILEKERNYSQKSFSIQFMTGEFSELLQMYYGLVRQAKPLQRMLNQAVSDFQGFLQTIPKGGVFIEADAVKNIKGFVETYAKAKEVTILNSGAISSGKILPKQAPPMPAGLAEMIEYADRQIMLTCGVTPEFLGMMTSKDITATLFRQQVRQSLLTLAVYFDAHSMYKKQQAMLYIDAIKILVENNQSKIIGHITSRINADALPMFSDFIAQVYDVEFEEVPKTPAQIQSTFEQLIQAQQALPNVDMSTIIADYLPVNSQTKEQLKALMQPPPPPQPDPMMQAMAQAQANDMNASAAKKQEEAKDISIKNLKNIEDLKTYDEYKQAELAKLLSEISVNMHKVSAPVRPTL